LPQKQIEIFEVLPPLEPDSVNSAVPPVVLQEFGLGKVLSLAWLFNFVRSSSSKPPTSPRLKFKEPKINAFKLGMLYELEKGFVATSSFTIPNSTESSENLPTNYLPLLTEGGKTRPFYVKTTALLKSARQKPVFTKLRNVWAFGTNLLKRGRVKAPARYGNPIDTTVLSTHPVLYMHIVKLENGLFVVYIGQGGSAATNRPGMGRVIQPITELYAGAFNILRSLPVNEEHAAVRLENSFANKKFKVALEFIRDSFRLTSTTRANYHTITQPHDRQTTSAAMRLDEKRALVEFLNSKTFCGAFVHFIGPEGKYIVVNDDPFKDRPYRPLSENLFFTCAFATKEQIDALSPTDVDNLHKNILPAGWSLLGLTEIRRRVFARFGEGPPPKAKRRRRKAGAEPGAGPGPGPGPEPGPAPGPGPGPAPKTRRRRRKAGAEPGAGPGPAPGPEAGPQG
jgi:hypothetical protein